jgi:hypothetical protein
MMKMKMKSKLYFFLLLCIYLQPFLFGDWTSTDDERQAHICFEGMCDAEKDIYIVKYVVAKDHSDIILKHNLSVNGYLGERIKKPGFGSFYRVLRYLKKEQKVVDHREGPAVMGAPRPNKDGKDGTGIEYMVVATPTEGRSHPYDISVYLNGIVDGEAMNPLFDDIAYVYETRSDVSRLDAYRPGTSIGAHILRIMDFVYSMDLDGDVRNGDLTRVEVGYPQWVNANQNYTYRIRGKNEGEEITAWVFVDRTEESAKSVIDSRARMLFRDGYSLDVYEGLGQEAVWAGDRRILMRRDHYVIDLSIGRSRNVGDLLELAFSVNETMKKRQTPGYERVLKYAGLLLFRGRYGENGEIIHEYVMDKFPSIRQSRFGITDKLYRMHKRKADVIVTVIPYEEEKLAAVEFAKRTGDTEKGYHELSGVGDEAATLADGSEVLFRNGKHVILVTKQTENMIHVSEVAKSLDEKF